MPPGPTDHSTNLMLPYLQPAQAQKHVTLNQALLRLDALVQANVASRTLAAEPASPTDGDLYILPAGKSGDAWSGMETGAFAYWRDGLWEEIVPREGWSAFIRDEATPVYFDGANWIRAIAADARERLSAARTYYVRTDGSDSNDGLANNAPGAFLTIQRAVDAAAALDLNNYDVTIQIGAGTYGAAVNLRTLVGHGKLILLGDTGTPANVVIGTTNASAVNAGISAGNAAEVRGHFAVRGVTLQTSGAGQCIRAVGAGVQIDFQSVAFGACAEAHLYAESGAKIDALGAYAINGAAAYHAHAQQRGQINIRSVTATLSGTPAFSVEFASAARGALINANGMTFSGAAAGKRYAADSNAIIYANAGATYLPGNASGTTANGGLYL